jgi:hypothetical protein
MNAVALAALRHANSSLATAGDDAADSLWIDEDCIAILLDADCPEGMELRSILQAVGVQVAMGPSFGLDDAMPLILVHAANRSRPEVKARMQLARDIYPDAPVVFVTRSDRRAPVQAALDEVRAILRARGIGFVAQRGPSA